MGIAVATIRQSQARCWKGHKLPTVRLRDGESVEQKCPRCGEVVKTSVVRNGAGSLAVSIDHRPAGA